MNPLRLFRNLAGRNDVELVRHLQGQMDATHEGVQLAHQLATGAVDSQLARELMGEIEHQGDDSRAKLVGELSRALTTPIDREDLFRLSRSVDDILDNLRDFVREHDLYRVRPSDYHAAVIVALTLGIKELERAMYHLPGDGSATAMGALSSKKVANNVRRMYQEQMARLLNAPFDDDTLKNRELLRRLDAVGLRLAEAADVLADAAQKRGH